MPATGSEETPPDDSSPSIPTDAIALDVRALHCFDPKGDPTSLSIRWKRWKRAFNLYVVSKGVKNDPQKVALLLHTGGMELQEVYYTLVAEDQESTFENCLTVLDNYFTPKANVPFERHGFRQMEQLTGETIDQFVSTSSKSSLV